MKTAGLVAAVLLMATFVLNAQPAPPAARPEPPRSLEVRSPGGALLSFRSRGRTTVELEGSERAPQASGVAKIESHTGYVEIEISRGDLRGLEPPTRWGRDFLTYVLWVVPMDGAAMNIGEVVLGDGRSEGLKVSAPYQTFWLMVTAEPDFAVPDPSPVVVLVSQNQEQTRTGNKALPVPAALVYYTHYTDYQAEAAVETAAAVPRELLQARKAMELATRKGFLAEWVTAAPEAPPEEKHAREILVQARAYLEEAERQLQSGGDNQAIVQFAQTAAQLAENARAVATGAVGGGSLRRLLAELDSLRAREAEAREQLSQAQRQLTSLGDRLSQLEGSLDLERRRTRELESQLLAMRERMSLLEGSLEGAREDTDRLRNLRGQICEELRRQLASLGQLTERGNELALTLASDILFDFNRYDLRPAARENLAKLSVLRLLLFPSAAVRYEGHTDLAGEEDYNQWLSEQRALSVYRYFLENQLAGSQIPEERADVEGRLTLVEQLLAMNFNAARRQDTRRQELLAGLGDVVVGKGMREPLVPERGPNEQNRRVTLIFPETTATGLTSLCPAVSPEPSPETPPQ